MKMQRLSAFAFSILLAFGAAEAQTKSPAKTDDRGSRTVLKAASGFVGLEVRDSAGERVGEVRDILLDTHRERLAYAVIATGGIMGIGDEVVVLPWRFLTIGEGEKVATVPIGRKTLLQTPKRTAEQSDDDFARAVQRFYGIPPYWEDRPARGGAGTSGSRR